MSGEASTDAAANAPSALVRAAADGELPPWARATPGRREHIGRVAALMREWAEGLQLTETERVRWVAVGWLHDVLRDASESELREILGEECSDLHPALLHGPAAARRLEGEADPAMLMAIRYHTLGHRDLDRLGRALYLADFLEPGRDFAVEWRASLRARLPAELDAVLLDVLGARLQHLIAERRPIRPETAAFWSAAVGGR